MWILIVTKPNQESVAADNLKRQGYEPYWPKCKELRGSKAVIRPLFPRYVFVGIVQSWYPITGTRGVSHVLLGTDGPLPVHEGIIKELRSREHHGLVSL